MYVLEVVFPNDQRPRHVEHRQNANDVLARVPELLQEHDGCEKVVVHMGPTRLFSVDCKGNTLPG